MLGDTRTLSIPTCSQSAQSSQAEPSPVRVPQQNLRFFSISRYSYQLHITWLFLSLPSKIPPVYVLPPMLTAAGK